MDVKGVIFDLDGVITDTAEFHYQAWKNMAASVDIEINKEFNEELKGISRMESLNKILEYGGKKNEFTAEEKDTLATEKNEEYVGLLERLQPSDIYPGIKEFITELQKHNIRLAIASASKNAPKILEKLKIIDEFKVIVDPASIANGKPAPDIFTEAQNALGLASEECVGVEDSLAGIESIKSAKQFAVGVGTFDVMKAAGADWVIQDTKDLTLKNIIEKTKNF